jgi:hypothetical protein
VKIATRKRKQKHKKYFLTFGFCVFFSAIQLEKFHGKLVDNFSIRRANPQAQEHVIAAGTANWVSRIVKIKSKQTTAQ